MFPICIDAPSFKKEGFGPEPPQKEKLGQNCEFFPEIFRHLSVQTGFLLATIRVGYPVAFENPTGRAEYSATMSFCYSTAQECRALWSHCPRVLCYIYFIALGIHPSMELMELRGHQWRGCLEYGCVELWKVLSPRVGARQRLLGQAVWGHWWERKPSLVAELNFLSSC